MSGANFVVPARSWDDIGVFADRLRQQFGLQDEPKFPIADFLERVLDQKLGLTRFEVGEAADMDGAEGLTDPRGEFIQLRLDVYQGACAGEPRPRFTAAHELGHFVLHTNIPLARQPPNISLPAYRLSEQQANQYAAELLMPRHLMKPNDNEHTVMERHGVSFEAARNCIRFMRGKLSK